jgi:CHAT domain-containing protein/tetratricopeptide (TPR) repeat protein
MVRPPALVACLVAFAFLAGPAVAATANGPVALQETTGTACHTAPRGDIAPDPNAPAPVYLLCGEASRPAGAVAATLLPLTLPNAPSARHSSLRRLAAASPAGRAAASRMVCKAGHWLRTPDGIDLEVAACSLIDGGWPQIRVVAAIGRYLLVGDGLPAVLPAIEAVMARQAGYAAPRGGLAFGGMAGARSVLAAAFGGKERVVGGADLDRYGALVERARLYASRRDFPAAETAYRQALDLQERAFGANNIGVATTLIDLALTVSNQGRFAEAAGLLRRADPIIEASNNPIYRARALEYRGFDAANQGKFADALRFAEAAVTVWRGLIAEAATPGAAQLSAGDQAVGAFRGELAHSLNLAAAMAWRVGNVAYAEAAANEALGIVGREPDLPPWWGPDILMTLGDVYARQGRLRQAEEALRGALIFNERLFGNGAPTAISLLDIGRVDAADGLYDEALRAFNYALQIMARDKVARSLLGYDQLAPLLVTVDKLAAAHPERRAALDATLFRAVQYLSTGVTAETIARASARVAAGNPKIENLVNAAQTARRERDAARIALAYETSLPQDQRGGDRERALLRKVNAENARLASLTAELDKAFPAYARLSSPSPVELQALQRRLRPGEAVVEFALGRDQAGVILVTARDFAAAPIAGNAGQIAAMVARMRRVLDARLGRINDFDVADAYRLYRMLFGPVAGHLAHVDRLIVVPGGALASLPLALLATAPPRAGGHDYRDAAWLVRRYAESVVPSVRAFLSLRDRANAAQAPRPFLGIGDPAFTGSPRGRRGPSGLVALATSCRGNGPVPAALLRALPPLPETAGEVEAVARALDAGSGDVLLGRRATEAAFRAEPLDQFRVLYFATHGLLPGELNCATEPALALSPPPTPARGKADDGLLEAGEIAGLRLNADLVVLSACDTAQGGGTELGGAALAGVAQAFFYAGARTLVATHWEIPSVPTVALMEGMFQRLGTGDGTAEALRQSQLALIARPATANPFYWAAFTVMGDGDSRTLPVAPAGRQAAVRNLETVQ